MSKQNPAKHVPPRGCRVFILLLGGVGSALFVAGNLGVEGLRTLVGSVPHAVGTTLILGTLLGLSVWLWRERKGGDAERLRASSETTALTLHIFVTVLACVAVAWLGATGALPPGLDFFFMLLVFSSTMSWWLAPPGGDGS